ncbi:thioredoxin family protein [Herbiconiux sp. CPCC 205763]|uniref:Thioredoxin family protein n=1 Tax=Herbiconiux aconitum TaxID=2970913 RepID=A0ABT2GTT6_9MICO|nr:thioredoxin family protein [Herbiconiux aconitum]MCS5719632.1 thioredoxin family protein [Herbiconiux aconitum]
MNLLVVIAFLIGLVAVSTLVGFAWKSRQGAARAVAAQPSVPPELFDAAAGTTPPRFGERATLVQFSTEFCSGCPATRRVLAEISTRTSGVSYLDVDVTHRPDLVQRFSILQTPTTLILDRDGVVRTRIGGAVRRAVVETRLKELA